MTTRKPTEERRREIADAAIRVIGERGLREFTAAQLAQEVGIADGTIFRHFKDKNEIALAVLDRLQELIEPNERPVGGPLERLKEFMMGRLLLVATQPGIQSILFSDQISHALGAEGPRRVAALRNRGRQFIRSCLAEAAQKGLIRGSTDIDSAVLLISGMVMSFLFAAKDGALSGPAGDMEQRCWRTVLVLLGGEDVTP